EKWCVSSLFFFQAEDGIRDFHVTGVQTCALPIFLPVTSWASTRCTSEAITNTRKSPHPRAYMYLICPKKLYREYEVSMRHFRLRSEERRVGKECRSRWAAADRERRHKTTRWKAAE